MDTIILIDPETGIEFKGSPKAVCRAAIAYFETKKEEYTKMRDDVKKRLDTIDEALDDLEKTIELMKEEL